MKLVTGLSIGRRMQDSIDHALAARLASWYSVEEVARFFAFIVVLTVAESVGVFQALGDETCSQACADDDGSGHCAPGCVDCSCCGHTRSVVVGPRASILSTSRPQSAPCMSQPAPRNPDPHEIFHVPRLTLA